MSASLFQPSAIEPTNIMIEKVLVIRAMGKLALADVARLWRTIISNFGSS